jgi:hypothetical protein
MSVTQPQTTPPAAPAPHEREITIISHSNLFYWWPVWAVGFLLGILSWLSGNLMATVPTGTEAAFHATVTGQAKGKEVPVVEIRREGREVLILPDPAHAHGHLNRLSGNLQDPPDNPRLHVAPNKGYGVLFAAVLLLCIVITNVPLRGMWSVMVIMTTLMLIIIFALAGWWGSILYTLGLLDIRINTGGYFFISGVLFLVWLLTFFFFDKQIYMVFTPGQLKVCTEIGGGEKVWPAFGTTLEKQRSDLFRHWILGLGSGDLIVKTGGAQPQHFDLPNVLFVGRKKQMIEDLLKKQAVIETR